MMPMQKLNSRSFSSPPLRLSTAPSLMASKMSSGGGDTQLEKEPDRRGGVITLTKPPETEKASELQKKEQVDKEPIWRVLLHNDNIHTFDYVIDTIVSVVRTVKKKKAHQITLEAHKSGMSTVTTTWKQLARDYSLNLQKAGLTSSIAPEKKKCEPE